MGGKSGIGGLVGIGVGFALGGPLGALALGAAGFGAGGQLDAAAAAEDLARRNKNLSKEQAAEVIRQSKIQAEGALAQGREVTGSQASSYAAGGVDVGSGSALLVMENTAAQFKTDAYDIMRAGIMEGRVINARAQAQLDQAKAGKRAATIGAIASIAGTAAQVGMLSAAKPGGTKTAGNQNTRIASRPDFQSPGATGGGGPFR